MPEGTQGPKKEPKMTKDDPDQNYTKVLATLEELPWDEKDKQDLQKYVQVSQKVQRIRSYFNPMIKWLNKMIGGAFEDRLTQKMAEFEKEYGIGAVRLGEFVVAYQGGVEKSPQRTLDMYQNAFRAYMQSTGLNAVEVEQSYKKLEEFVTAQVGEKYTTADKLKIDDLKKFVKKIKKEKAANESKQLMTEGFISAAWDKISQWLIRVFDKATRGYSQANQKLKQATDQMQHQSTAVEAKMAIRDHLHIKGM